MILGRVTGVAVATHKHYKLEGRKLLLVQPLDLEGKPRGVAILAVGARAVRLDDARIPHGEIWVFRAFAPLVNLEQGGCEACRRRRRL